MKKNLQDILQFEIELLEIEKSATQKKIQEISKRLHYKYQLLLGLDDLESVRIRLGDLIESLKEITGYDDLSIKLYVLAAFFQNTNEEKLKESLETMRFLGSDLRISLENHDVIYSHLNLFNDFNEIQLDGETLLDHCSIYPKNGFCDLVVDKDLEDVVCTFHFQDISPDGMAKTNDSSALLEQAVIHCMMKQKTNEYQKKKTKLN